MPLLKISYVLQTNKDIGHGYEYSLSKTTRRQDADGAASKQEVSKPSGLRIGSRGRRHEVGGQIGINYLLTKVLQPRPRDGRG